MSNDGRSQVTHSMIEFKTTSGGPIDVAGSKVTLRARVLVIRLPFLNGGLIWNRPLSASIRTREGREIDLPIPDMTRRIIWSLFGVAFIGALVWGSSRRKD